MTERERWKRAYRKAGYRMELAMFKEYDARNMIINARSIRRRNRKLCFRLVMQFVKRGACIILCEVLKLMLRIGARVGRVLRRIECADCYITEGGLMILDDDKRGNRR